MNANCRQVATYTHPKRFFTLEYPSDWIAVNYENIDAVNKLVLDKPDSVNKVVAQIMLMAERDHFFASKECGLMDYYESILLSFDLIAVDGVNDDVLPLVFNILRERDCKDSSKYEMLQEFTEYYIGAYKAGVMKYKYTVKDDHFNVRMHFIARITEDVYFRATVDVHFKSNLNHMHLWEDRVERVIESITLHENLKHTSLPNHQREYYIDPS